MSSPYLPYARFLLRGALCFGLAIAAWEAGRWARQRQPSPVAETRAISPPKPPASSPEESVSLETRLQRLLARPAGLERRLALMKFRDAVPLSAIPELLAGGMLSSSDDDFLARQWAAHDPAGFFEWEMARARSGSMISHARAIFTAWAKSDPAAAVSALGRLSTHNEMFAFYTLFDAWASGEAEVSAGLSPYLKVFAQRAVSELRRMARYEKDGVLSARIMALPASPEKTQLLMHYAAGVSLDDWQKGLAWAKQLPLEEQPEVLQELAEMALRSNEEANQKQPAKNDRLEWARHWLAEEADDAARVKLGSLYVKNLSATDPNGALHWAQEWLGGTTLANAVTNVVAAQFQQDREAALTLVDELPPGGVRIKAAQALATKWAEQEPAAAILWAREQGREVLSSEGWGRVGSRWASDDPAGFKAWLGQETDEVPDRLIGWGVDHLVKKDVAGTAEWAATLPPGTQKRALSVSLNVWAEGDPAAASRFVASHPDLSYAENSLESLARKFFARDAEAAVAWVEELPASPGREAALKAACTAAEKAEDSPHRAAWLHRLK